MSQSPQGRKTDQKPVPAPAGDLDARFCEVMDAAPVMVWVAGEDKGCVWFNKPWLTFTGRRLAEEVGYGWSEGVHRDDFERCLRIYSSHFDARKDFRIQYRLRRNDGKYRWIDDTGIPRFSHDGAFLGYIGSCMDVHEHRETQSELRQRLLEIAELNRRADSAILSASIVHEIKQPLAAIVSSGQAALRWFAQNPPNTQRVNSALNNIVLGGYRAAEIVDNIRAINKNEHRIDAPFSVNELIQDVLLLAEADLQNQHITVRTTVSNAIPDVAANRVQLQQVMLNLIKNAMEAMTAVADSSRVLHLKTEFDDSENIVITVQDSGPGIGAENTERIFDRFFTTKPQGMGMGLAICRSIIEAHKGKLWAEAGVESGSIFRILLPKE